MSQSQAQDYKIIDEEHIQNDEPFDIDRVIQWYKLTPDEIEYLRKMTITPAQRRTIMGHKQRSKEWLNVRNDRITASNFGGAIDHSKYDNANGTLRKMLWPGGFQGNAATRYGTENEPIAAKIYEDYMRKQTGPSGVFGVSFPNLVVPTKHPWAGVSPDGFVYHNGLRGGLEIKCPFRQQFYNVIPSMYYDQIQGTMGFLGLKFWDFVVWTPEATQIRRFHFDEQYWSTVLFPKLEMFYMKSYLPRAVLKQQGKLEQGAINVVINIPVSYDFTADDDDVISVSSSSSRTKHVAPDNGCISGTPFF